MGEQGTAQMKKEMQYLLLCSPFLTSAGEFPIPKLFYLYHKRSIGGNCGQVQSSPPVATEHASAAIFGSISANFTPN
jgi:hypothetical protein